MPRDWGCIHVESWLIKDNVVPPFRFVIICVAGSTSQAGVCDVDDVLTGLPTIDLWTGFDSFSTRRYEKTYLGTQVIVRRTIKNTPTRQYVRGLCIALLLFEYGCDWRTAKMRFGAAHVQNNLLREVHCMCNPEEGTIYVASGT